MLKSVFRLYMTDILESKRVFKLELLTHYFKCWLDGVNLTVPTGSIMWVEIDKKNTHWAMQIGRDIRKQVDIFRYLMYF